MDEASVMMMSDDFIDPDEDNDGKQVAGDKEMNLSCPIIFDDQGETDEHVIGEQGNHEDIPMEHPDIPVLGEDFKQCL